MSDVTRILLQIEQGDPQAAEQLLPLVYNELRKLAAAKLAHEKPGQTLQATALVHDAYIRLVDVEKAQNWDSRWHFFSAAAESMQRILIENARRKKRLKRGGQWERAELPDVSEIEQAPLDDLIDLDQALRKLGIEDQEKAEVVKLRFFAGLHLEEISQILGIAVPTVKRHWRYARAWLHREMHQDSDRGSTI
jgi:RNA polymerase sigma factor (TIGR02999 family)